MTIRNKLALRFMLLASLIMGVVLIVVYTMSGRYRIEEFRSRIVDRGNYTATLLLQFEEVDGSLLTKIQRDSPTHVPGEAIKIFDHQDRELFSSGFKQWGPITPELLARVRNSSEPYDLQDNGEALGFSFTNGQEKFVVLVAGEDVFGKSKLRNLGQVMVITYSIGVLITFLVGRIYAQRALAPLQDLVGEVSAIDAGNLLQRVEPGESVDEIAQLRASFNGLLERLEMAFNAQRSFIANASHELRTPLTVISGQLEVLLLMDRTTDEYRNAVASVLEDMRALNRLSNRLLLLAQASSNASQTTFRPVRIDEMIWQARSELLKARPEMTVECSMTEVDDERYMQVPGNENLLRSLIYNLMENGCKYSPDERCEVSLAVVDGVVRLEFADNGIGIPTRERDRVFNSFYRCSNASGVDGHGIGLSLVKRISELHGGSVVFFGRPSGGTTFTVELPHL